STSLRSSGARQSRSSAAATDCRICASPMRSSKRRRRGRRSTCRFEQYEDRRAGARGFDRQAAVTTRYKFKRRRVLRLFGAAAALVALPRTASAADPFKIGLVLPLTGPFASTGRQVETA